MSAGVAVLRLHADDDVGVAMRAIAPGERVEYGLTARQAIGRGHKSALHDVGRGAAVRKFGQPIGIAAADIAAGARNGFGDLEFVPGQLGAVL